MAAATSAQLAISTLRMTGNTGSSESDAGVAQRYARDRGMRIRDGTERCTESAIRTGGW
jgi:hypothetical protein